MQPPLKTSRSGFNANAMPGAKADRPSMYEPQKQGSMTPRSQMSEFAPMRQSMSQNNNKQSFQTQQFTPHSQGRSSEYARRQSRGNLSQHNANPNEQSLEYVYRKKVPMQTKR